MRHINASKESLFSEVGYYQQAEETMEVEIAFQWNTGYNTDGIHSFANGITTIEGGMHEEGFKKSLTNSVNKYAKDKGLLKASDAAMPMAARLIFAILFIVPSPWSCPVLFIGREDNGGGGGLFRAWAKKFSGSALPALCDEFGFAASVERIGDDDEHVVHHVHLIRCRHVRERQCGRRFDLGAPERECPGRYLLDAGGSSPAGRWMGGREERHLTRDVEEPFETERPDLAAGVGQPRVRIVRRPRRVGGTPVLPCHPPLQDRRPGGPGPGRSGREHEIPDGRSDRGDAPVRS